MHMYAGPHVRRQASAGTDNGTCTEHHILSDRRLTVHDCDFLQTGFARLRRQQVTGIRGADTNNKAGSLVLREDFRSA
nr:hypothetical protein [Ornithinimicrobium pratense]